MRSVYAAIALMLIGCGGETLDVGDDAFSRGGTDAGSAETDTLPVRLQTQPICDDRAVDAPNAAWPDPLACAANATGEQSEVVGVWEGYTEDSNFNPIAPLRLSILSAAPGHEICGTIKYGEGDPPPLTNDPAAFYPPLASGYYGAMTPPFPTGSPQYWGLLTGYTYTIVSGGMADSQVRFQVSANEHYRGWCGLQSAYPSSSTASDGYNCSPVIQSGDSGYWGADSPEYCNLTVSGVAIKLPAAQCELCGAFSPPVCVCDSCHCTARLEATHEFELTFSGDQATGTTGNFNGPAMPIPNPIGIRLKRVAP